LCLLPLRLVASLTGSAELIDPGGVVARRWRVGVLVVAGLTLLHVAGACARGGRLRHFALPFGNPFWIARRLRAGGAYAASREAVLGAVSGLRLPYYSRLGALGALATALWLAVPASLMAAGRRLPVLNLLGALLLGLVALALPFLQARFAAENRFGAMFSRREARLRTFHAPWAYALALALMLTSAVPLYLFKIEIIPQEAAWLPGLVFLAFTFPARLATGWAYGRASRRETPRHWFFRWTGRLAVLPVVAVYVLIVYLSQYTAWRGVWSLYEQHAFLLPVPFLGL
jgi:hypothetical protein